MTSYATPASVPAESAINAHLPGASFCDCYSIDASGARLTALDYFLAAIARTPPWVERLMLLRNKVVRFFGLKDLGGLGGLDISKPASAYVPGDRVGIFTLISNTDGEVLLGESDKHLNVVLAVFRHQPAAESVHTISITTVVHVHNWLGRLYMLPVKPMHKLIAPAVLNRITAATPIY
jgi:hypothetical protein